MCDRVEPQARVCYSNQELEFFPPPKSRFFGHSQQLITNSSSDKNGFLHKDQNINNNARTRITPRNNFRLMFTNADILTQQKLLELKTRVVSRDAIKKPHLIMISEVKPKNFTRTLTKKEYEIDGYQLESVNLTTKHGRGLFSYIRDGIDYKEINLGNDFCEYHALEFQINSHETLLTINVYRSGSSSDENTSMLNDLLRKVARDKKYKYIVIAGDINFRRIDWPRNYCNSSENSNDFLFLEAVKDSFMTQHVDEPTRGRGQDTPSTLDILLTGSDDIVEDLEIDAPLGKSDHSVIWATIVCNLQTKPTTKTKYLYNKADYTKLKEELNVNWGEIFENLETPQDVNEMWGTFKNRMNQALDNCVPKRTITIGGNNKQRHKALDKRLLAKIKRKKRLWERYIKTQDGIAYLQYCKVRNQLRAATRKAQKQIEKNIAKQAKANPKLFWCYVNSRTKSRSAIPDLLLDDDSQIPKFTTTDQEKAERFNEFFASVFNSDPGSYNKALPRRTEDTMSRIIVDTEDVKKRLQKLNVNKSQGPDGLHPRILREASEQIAAPLAAIYTASINSGTIPDDWKLANVTAIYKNKGKKNVAGNYRPVSLTSIACKLLESIVREQIMEFLKKGKLLSNKQFGFLGGRSTTLQLLKVLDEWTSILDQGGTIDVIYFDFMKAFDKVHHGRLLAKLKSYGIDGLLHSWIESFLSDRKQRVVVNNSQSDWASVTSGVPQGSVLGPLLFVLFINDLPEVIDKDSSMYLFADDTKLFREIRKIGDSEVLQFDINSMDEWGDEWQMFYHPSKCNVLKLGKRITELNDTFQPYILKNTMLDVVTSEKDLGVTIDVDLTFEQHIIDKVNKANKVAGIIRRTFQHLDADMFMKLYKALVRPHLEYANQVWAPQTRKHIELLENVQRRATKMIPGFYTLSYEERLRKLKLPTLAYRRLRGDLIETYKILTNKYDADVSDNFIKLRKDSVLPGAPETRGNSLRIYPECANLDMRKNSFPNRIADVWNGIPESVISAETIECFEARLDRFMIPQDIIYNHEATYKNQPSN